MPSEFSLADQLLPHNYGEKYVYKSWKKYDVVAMVYAWFDLGMGFGGTCCSGYGVNSMHAYENADTPAVINTVQTIPVEVYKLERED